MVVSKTNKTLWKKRVQELFEKKFITKNESFNLDSMIDSPDNENFSIVEQIIKNMIKTKLSEGLKVNQVNVYNKILDFIDSDTRADALVLKGYAGTGKTFLVKKIIEYVIQTNPKKKIAISAPTNKAVRVLYMNSAANLSGEETYVFEDIFDGNSRLTYSTIHKLLGLKETVTDTGQQLFSMDSKNDSELSDYDYLIVDEVSMLDDQICHDIMKFSKKIPIIFLGDPAQIPAINHKDSIPFKGDKKYVFETLELTEIIRQSVDNPIINASFTIRNNLTMEQPLTNIVTNLNSKGFGIVCINAINEKDKVRPLLESYFKSDNFQNDSDYMKVLAWRNKTIDYINNVVRELLFGSNPAKYIIGEKLVSRKPIFEKVVNKGISKYKDYWKILFTTSEEFTVESIKIINKTFKEGEYTINMSIYELGVTSIDPDGSSSFNTINVVHEDSFKHYSILLEKAKQIAIKARYAGYWVNYYNMMKWSADISYNYALSIHKAQGSTYSNVFIIEDDIDRNTNIVERNKIKYTSYTRPTDKLFIFKSI